MQELTPRPGETTLAGLSSGREKGESSEGRSEGTHCQQRERWRGCPTSSGATVFKWVPSESFGLSWNPIEAITGSGMHLP